MDLTTPDYVLAVVTTLSAAQKTALPQQVAACSALLNRWCNRPLGLQTGLDEAHCPLRGEDALLRSYPVASIDQVAIRPRGIMSVRRTMPASFATAEVPSDAPSGHTGSSLVLRAKSLGTWSESTIEFATLRTPTVGALAAAVNALPGWWAGVDGGVVDPDFGTDDIIAGLGPVPAPWTGTATGQLRAYTEQARYRIDRAAGTLALLDEEEFDPFTSFRFGPAGAVFEDGDQEIGGRPVRVRYAAGYDPIPLDVQSACAELVKATFERFGVSSVLQSERTGSWSWTAREFGEVVGGMPDAVRQVISSYRDHAR